ncbi:MAG: hypothetical protein IPI38_17430 [Gemmatimonadetes bacterium]|nr:hypothetical protein [Gemmatimonadota bacterium]
MSSIAQATPQGVTRRCQEHRQGRDSTGDEYPPAILNTGGTGASVRYVTPSDNRGAGASIGNQLRQVPDGSYVSITVVP